MFDVFNGTSASSVDVLNAMNTAISEQSSLNIVAVSMSLGDGTSNAGPCTDSIFSSAVASAGNAGITTVAAAGNSGSKSGLGNPACTPGVVSVGAVYDASYGTVEWVASADSGGTCTDASAADHVTCFSQSAAYLSMLAPGTFVNAPNSSFQQSGTSQATPHVAGAVAVLRARYAAESLAETLQRLQLSDIQDTDSANGRVTPRLDLLAAVNQGTALSLSGSGPAVAASGGTATYSLTVTDSGPLAATDVVITDTLPAGAALQSSSAGCSLAGSTVSCALGSLAAGGHDTVTLNVKWTVSGAVYDSASVHGDQINSAAAAQQTLAFGAPPESVSDGPVPPWAYVLLSLMLWYIGRRQLGPAAMRVPARPRKPPAHRVHRSR
ncbi:MAG TPA: S8 family serine peptidase [Rhodopila sp.]